MIPLIDKEIKFYQEQNVCHICKGWFCCDENNESEFKLRHKVKDHCQYTRKFRGAAHNIRNLTYKVTKKIPVVFHNGSTYDYHFIIKQLADTFKGQFECLGENTKKYIAFSLPIKKEVEEEEAAYGKEENSKKKQDHSKKEDDNSKKKENNHIQIKV